MAEEKKNVLVPSSSGSFRGRTFRDILKAEEKVKFRTGKHVESNKQQLLPSLIYEVLKWSLPDILNENLYKDKVEKIPETFTSVQHYLLSYKYPLVEETHADMLSSISLLSLAPIRYVISFEKSKVDEQPNHLFYDVKFGSSVADTNRDLYEPQTWDVIALSNVILRCIDDLDRPPYSYVPAVVLSVGQQDGSDVLKVCTLKPVCFQQQKKRGEAVFATFLINMTTNIRIWGALNEEQRNLNLIKEVLDVDLMAVNRCDICSSEETPNWKQDLYANLESMNLNESQTNAVLNSIETRKCSHRSSVRLIWGPPGTGKTKTISTLLWLFFTMECRTVTCAPTNIAVMQVASSFLKLVRGYTKGELYGLGDILLFGSEKSLKVDDQGDLSVLYLNHRVSRLVSCLVPLMGWRHQVDSMILLLEDPNSRYRLYLDRKKKDEEELHGDKEKDTHVTSRNTVNTVKQENTKEVVVQSMENKDENTPCDRVFTFLEFLRKEFGSNVMDLERAIQNLCTHLPTSVLSERVAVMMKKVLSLLKSLRMSLLNGALSNEELEKSFEKYDELVHTSDQSTASMLVFVAKKCLQILKSIYHELSVPDCHDWFSVRKFCLENACIVFCTASKSANLHEVVKPFEMLIIDEAAQLKECETAIPLQLPGLRHAILIGDERQLPAMIRSKMSEEAELGRSMFKRLVSLGQKKHLLSIQYRMHPSISLFPNTEFYGMEISDSPSVQNENYKKHLLQGNMYASYSFINVLYGKEVSTVGHSLRNMEEIAVISEIVAKLYKASVASNQMISVGVVSPYKAQVFEIQKKLKCLSETRGKFSLNIRSVDGFQGGEEDVIIISTVRANTNGSVGFLADHQRTNVALTRARYCLWIVGNGPTLLKSNSIWRKLVLDAQNRGCYFNADEDETLVKALLESIKIDQLNDLLNMNSTLFKSARWKVTFSNDFWKSLSRIKDGETRKELVELLMKLSNGWRQSLHQQNIIVGMDDGTSSQLLEQYKVKDLLYLVWSVDIMKEGLKLFQVLKFWDILALSEVPNLAKRLDEVFESYTVANMNRCKFKNLEGELVIPMIWEISQAEAVKLEKIHKNEHEEQLSSELASLRLNEGRSRPASFSRGRGRKGSNRRGRF